MKLTPPIVIVPVREAAPKLLATEYDTAPFPMPELPEVMVSQLSLLVAVHPHPPAVATLMLPVPPAAAKFCSVESRVKEHEPGAPTVS